MILIVNLEPAPDIHYIPNGAAVTNIALTITETQRDKTTGEMREQSEWHRGCCSAEWCTKWPGTASIATTRRTVFQPLTISGEAEEDIEQLEELYTTNGAQPDYSTYLED